MRWRSMAGRARRALSFLAGAITVKLGSRTLILFLLATFGLPPIIIWAQATKTSFTVAILNPLSSPDPGVESFRAGLREIGYTEGQNLALELRWANGELPGLPNLAAELVALNPDVMFVVGEHSLSAAKQATLDKPIPLVVFACDPLDKFIFSLARPGGSATGLSCVLSDLASKRLQYLKEAMPELTRAAVLYNPADPNKISEFRQLEDAGQRLRISVHAFEVRDLTGVESAFTTISNERLQAVVILVEAFTIFHRRKLAELAVQHRVPMVSGFKEFAEAGALLSYGAQRSALFRRAATYVDRILKGAKAGDLPVEEPTQFELFINQKTAKAIGLTIPPSLLVRADQVIE
jgi:putative tryptophan/tyrosine transport system substrate-binding protein